VARSEVTAPAPPKVPVVTAEKLAANARLSKVDGFGKIKCRVCGKMYTSYRPLEQHLAASHFGLNSMEAKAIEAALIAAGHAVPGDGGAKTKPERMALQLGEILQQPRGRPGDAPIANLAASLSAYIREAKPSKKERRATAAAAAVGRPRVGGEMMMNPNQASSTAMVKRRGKEQEGGKKKKKLTKLKKIIVREREERATAKAAAAEEVEAEATATATAAAAAEAEAEREIEVTIEVGRVYVNLVIMPSGDGAGDGGDAGRVAVDLIYLEDDGDDSDDDGDSEDEADESEEALQAAEALGAAEAADAAEAVEAVRAAAGVEAAAAADTAPAVEGTPAAVEGAPELQVPADTDQVAAGVPTESSACGPGLADVVATSAPWGAPSAWGSGRGFRDVLLGAKEDEEEEEKEEEEEEETADPAAQGAGKGGSGGKKAKAKGAKEKGVMRTCETCGVVCSGPDAWESHIAGKKHASAERRAAAAAAAAAGVGGSAAAPAAAPVAKKVKQQPHTYLGTGASIRYCAQVISPDLNAAVVECIGELKRFQDRAYAKDPIKAKMRRRLVFGLREVAKAVQLGHAKAVVVAPNIEQTESEGGLDDMLGRGLHSSTSQLILSRV
jgi:selenocysteine insertion sequence-binding protein 2